MPLTLPLALRYESDMLKPIMQHCPQLAYALTFTDFSTTDYWVPLPGQKTYPGFMKFYEDDHTMFLNDTLWKDTTYYRFITGFEDSAQGGLALQSRDAPVEGESPPGHAEADSGVAQDPQR